MKKITLFSFLLIFNFSVAQTQVLQWAKQFGNFPGSQMFIANSIAVDNSGNVYTAGTYRGLADFDPGPATFTLPANDYHNAFISKLDAQGNFFWARSFYGGPSSPFTPTAGSVAYGIDVDNNGNVFTTGNFTGIVDFDPGTGIYNLTSSTSVHKIFISKLDAQGNFVWAKELGGSVNDIGRAIALDQSGNANITGRVSSKTFVAKLGGSGNFTFTLTLGNSGSGGAITVDAVGRIYTTGQGGVGDFDPGPGVFNLTPLGPALWISKLDAAGNFLWAGQVSGTGADDMGIDIEVDSNGNMYALGDMTSSSGTITDMDPGPGYFPIVQSGTSDIFVLKLDPAGNFIWAKAVASFTSVVSFVFPRALALDANANVYTIGVFDGTTDFDPGPAIHNVPSDPPYSPFVLKFDAAGTFVQVQLDSSYHVPATAAVIKNGYIYCTALLNGQGDFNYEPGTFTLSNNFGLDAVVFKKSLCVNGPSLIASSSASVMCAGENAILTAGGGGSYTWQPGGSTPVILVSPTVTTTYTLSGKDTDNCFEAITFTQTVVICSSIGNTEGNPGSSTIYPNPSSEFVTIKIVKPGRIIIYDVLGKVVYRNSLSTGETTIDIRNFDSGIYFMNIENLTGVFKLIKTD